MTNGQPIAQRYQLGDLIGSGAMGDVYRATDTQTGETVAIKHLKSELVRRDDMMLERFIREGETLRELNHPNIAALLDAVEEDGEHYLVIEYIPRGDLHAVIGDSPGGLPIADTLRIGIELADALTRAHYRHVIHRDLKPANILIADDGSPRLTDFGHAHHADAMSLSPDSGIVGTLFYLSPEACLGERIDERADIWAFGVVLYEMLTAQRPFDGSNAAAVISAILNNPTPDLQQIRADVPDDLADLILRMLTKSRDARIPSVRLVGVEIERMLNMLDIGTSLIPALDANRPARPRVDSVFDTPTPQATPQRSNLPVQSTPFVGREDHLSQVEHLMGEGQCRMLTLLGPGGMGKTRLGIEAASRMIDHYEHGAYFVGLAPVQAAENIVPTIADAVGYRFHGGGSPEEELQGYLANKSMLLVIDNFEHLAEGANTVAAIIDSAPAVYVLATSRARLNIGAECVYEIGGMIVPENEDQTVFEEVEAVEMFITNARRARPGFELTPEDRPAIVRICRLVGGMPLGLELAASWARMLAPEDIAAELEADIDFLESERGDLPERQRSMRAAFDYSWNLLDDQERQALMRFSVFRGGSSRKAAQEVTGASLRTLVALVDQSLIQRSGASGTFTIHELLRQFATEHLHDSGDEADIRTAHARYYLTALAAKLPDLKGWDMPEAIADIESDIENVRAAWSWGLEQGMLAEIDRAIDPLFLFLYQRSRFNDIGTFFEEARGRLAPAAGEAPSLIYSKILTRRWGYVQAAWGSQEMDDDVEAAYQIALDHDDAFEIAFSTLVHGISYYKFRDDPEGAVVLFKEALARFQTIGDDYYVVWALHRVGYAYILLNQSGPANLYTQQSLDLALQIGDRLAAANCQFNIASYDISFGDYETARGRLEQAMQLATEIDPKLWQIVHAGALLAITQITLGEFDKARLTTQATLALSSEIVWPSDYSQVPGILLASLDEDYELARQHGAEARRLESNRFGHTLADWGMSLVEIGARPDAFDSKSLHDPIEYWIDYLNADDENLLPGGMLVFFPAAAVVLEHDGKAEQAAELVALCLTHENAPVAFHEALPVLQRLRRSLEDQLGAEGFQAAWERGSKLSTQQVIDILIEGGFSTPAS